MYKQTSNQRRTHLNLGKYIRNLQKTNLPSISLAFYLYFFQSPRKAYPYIKIFRNHFMLLTSLKNMILKMSQIPSVYLTRVFKILTLKVTFIFKYEVCKNKPSIESNSAFNLIKSFLKSNTQKKKKIRFESKTQCSSKRRNVFIQKSQKTR